MNAEKKQRLKTAETDEAGEIQVVRHRVKKPPPNLCELY